MSGAGNLFSVLDLNSYNYITDLPHVARLVCGNSGINSMKTEGLLAIKSSHIYDFECFYYNPDGSTGMMCGNGGRCAVKFAYDEGIINNAITEEVSFYMADQEYSASFDSNGIVHLKLPAPQSLKRDIVIHVDGELISGDYVNVGSDHLVIRVDDIDEVDVETLGSKIRNHEFFQPNGTNVNFYQVMDNHLKIRTFERGVEAETGACGTGTISSALIHMLNTGCTTPLTLIPTSAIPLEVDLILDDDGNISKFILSGPAEYIGEEEFAIDTDNSNSLHFSHSNKTMKDNDIQISVNKIYDKIITYRRHIHQNPELSYQEYKTADFIRKKLSELEINFYPLAGTGTVALIGEGDKCVALRADIDALPIMEETGLEFRSQNNGVMHACGHDMHISMLLGAAEVLKNMESELNGCVKLIFQPAEEKLPGGAQEMIKLGVLKDPVPQMVFGQHIFPEGETGTIHIGDGVVMAAADELFWRISGSGSHAAHPHVGKDPIAASAALITYYQSMITKFRNPFDAGVLSVTSIHGGNANNIFPDEVLMKGTMRSFNRQWREEFHDKLHEKSIALCRLFDCECDLEIRKGYPPLANSASAVAIARNASKILIGEENTHIFEPRMWAEDFAYFAAELPAVFWFLGVKKPELESMAPLHNSHLDPDEEAMRTGMAMMVKCATDFLNG